MCDDNVYLKSVVIWRHGSEPRTFYKLRVVLRVILHEKSEIAFLRHLVDGP